jgi:hypothetical protein
MKCKLQIANCEIQNAECRTSPRLRGIQRFFPLRLRGGARGGVSFLKFISLRFSFTIFALFAFWIISGCENQPTEVENYQPEPVLNAFLFNGEPLTEVHLERVASLYGDFRPANHGISGAQVRIFEVGGGDTLSLVEDPAEHGRYIPAAGDTLIPREITRYRIEVSTPAGEILWAETTVPGAMETNGAVQLFYPGAGGLPHTISNGDTLTRDYPDLNLMWSDVDAAGGFQSVILTLTDRDSLVPLDPEWDPNDPDTKIEDGDRWRFTEMEYRYDQRWTVLMWFFFFWEGPHRIELRAISAEYYDYLFSLFRMEQGMINEPVSNIHGGRGVFGGLSRWQCEIYMKKVGG